MANKKTVGVVAVDPTSPFTGGALLGDRIRMNKYSMDEKVFIRSLGNHGDLGGLSRTLNIPSTISSMYVKSLFIFPLL